MSSTSSPLLSKTWLISSTLTSILLPRRAPRLPLICSPKQSPRTRIASSLPQTRPPSLKVSKTRLLAQRAPNAESRNRRRRSALPSESRMSEASRPACLCPRPCDPSRIWPSLKTWAPSSRHVFTDGGHFALVDFLWYQGVGLRHGCMKGGILGSCHVLSVS